jgi:hypothetical protein
MPKITCDELAKFFENNPRYTTALRQMLEGDKRAESYLRTSWNIETGFAHDKDAHECEPADASGYTCE